LINISHIVVAGFGLFLIAVGFLMLLAPSKAREFLKKAGSTPSIHYGELILRMIPAAGLVVYADQSEFPEFFTLLGWFMLGSSVLLIALPRKYHHTYAQKCAYYLNPLLIRMIAPLAFAFGGSVLYAVL